MGFSLPLRSVQEDACFKFVSCTFPHPRFEGCISCCSFQISTTAKLRFSHYCRLYTTTSFSWSFQSNKKGFFFPRSPPSIFVFRFRYPSSKCRPHARWYWPSKLYQSKSTLLCFSSNKRATFLSLHDKIRTSSRSSILRSLMSDSRKNYPTVG